MHALVYSFTLAVGCCLLSVCLADKDARIVNYQHGIQEDGSFRSEYQTTNGIRSTEEGTSYPGREQGLGNYVRSGSYEYTWEGLTFKVDWTADENGFHPRGKHLPDFSYTNDHIGDVSDVE